MKPIDKKLALIFGVLYFGIAAVYIAAGMGYLSKFVPELAYLGFPFLAVIGGIMAVRSYGLKSGHGKTLLLFTLGLGSWLVAEIIWFVLDYGFGLNPFPSIADLFFIIGYPLICAAIISEIVRRKVSLTLNLILLLVAIVINFGAFLAYVLIKNLSQGESSWANVFSLGYGIGDFLLLFVFLFVIFLAYQYEGGKLFQPWLILFVGLACFFAADLLFAFYGTAYEAKGLIFIVTDLSWILAYLFFATGLFNFWLLTKEMAEQAKQKLHPGDVV